MNKQKFLEQLEERLIGIPKEDKKEILQDYEEHFKIGKKKKRNEEEISKSLGNPKEIAKEIRDELSEKGELKTEAIETWVSLKKFSINMFEFTKEKTMEAYDNFDSKKLSHWFLLVIGIIVLFTFIGVIGGGFFFFLILAGIIFFILKTFEEDGKIVKKNSSKNISKKKGKKTNSAKLMLATLFNIFIFIWIWIFLFFAIIGLIISGVAMIVAGILLIVFSVFYLMTYSGGAIRDVLFSSLFAGVGIAILGSLFIILFDKVYEFFMKFTKKYIEINKEFIKK